MAANYWSCQKNFNPIDKKTKRETLAFVGKRTLKKLKVDMEIMRLKAKLFCKLWQQANNLYKGEL